MPRKSFRTFTESLNGLERLEWSSSLEKVMSNAPRHAPPSGKRRRNDLPLVIGGDGDANGTPTSVFKGTLDEVRLSASARYSGERFEVPTRFNRDEATVLLYHFDGSYGPYHHDDSGRSAHGTAISDPKIAAHPQRQ